MEDNIKWWQSRTVWALLVGLLCHLLAASGVAKVSNEEQQHIVELLLQAIGFASDTLGIMYRVKAQSRIS